MELFLLFLLAPFFVYPAFGLNKKHLSKHPAGIKRTSPSAFREPHSARSSSLHARQSSPYLNNVTQNFVVDGTGLPDVDFDIGESYAGLLPISSASNETRELFFWFFPSANPAASDEITIWFNGGPGCSSLDGVLQENGPFSWQPGTYAPTQNSYSWSNLTNMLYVEQPVGVGFTRGTPNITNEVQLTQEFMGFYRNFVDAFEVHNRKVYITGESYAGFYIPYVADGFIGANDTQYFNLSGAIIIDPIIGDSVLQQEVPMVDYADNWSNLFYLNESTVSAMHAANEECGYRSFIDTYLTFPPPGPFASPYPANFESCDTMGLIESAETELNPCFNVYHITDTCPFLWTTLGPVNYGDYVPPGSSIYFNRTDVQAAIHAPVGTSWQDCESAFEYGYDQSDPPATNGVLSRVVESTNNVIIAVGNLDFLLPTNGTLLAIQNMTWNGLQGFQSDPRGANDFYVPYHPEYNHGSMASAGIVGQWGSERGLTFANVQLSGHEMPEYAPGAAYRMLEVILGRVSDLSTVSDFTTESGNYTGESTGGSSNSTLGLKRSAKARHASHHV